MNFEDSSPIDEAMNDLKESMLEDLVASINYPITINDNIEDSFEIT